MSNYSVAEAKNNLSDLIDRALKGEGVVITRHGTPVIEFTPVAPVGKPVTKADIEWLAANIVQPDYPPVKEAGEMISEMRDEGEH